VVELFGVYKHGGDVITLHGHSCRVGSGDYCSCPSLKRFIVACAFYCVAATVLVGMGIASSSPTPSTLVKVCGVFHEQYCRCVVHTVWNTCWMFDIADFGRDVVPRRNA
jgi:hypothetical protein